MWELAAQLVPEMVGLVITPAAVVACLLLLGSSHPFRNVAVLGGAFLLVYGVLGVVMLAAGRAAGASTDDPSTTRGGIGVVIGGLFLAAGGWSWWRARRSAGARSEPAWVARLRDPSPVLVLGAGLVLAAVNPNVAILASGLGVVVTADVGTGARTGGVALLLAASMLDFVAPTLVFVVAGARGRQWLREATGWLLAHNQAIGVVVLLGFGLLFTGRGLGQLVG